MKIAVSGSHGLIGSALVLSLEGDGHTVVRLGRDEADLLELRGVAGTDAVVHLAGEGIGEKRWTDKQKRKVIESRSVNTQRLAEALAGLDEPPAVLVSGSAIGYYGDRGDEVLTEASGPGGLFLSEICVAWEAATAPAEEAGIRVAHIRTGIVLSRRGGALERLAKIFKLGVGGRVGSGKQWWSWISLADEVRAIRFVLDQPIRGAVNLVAPNTVTNAVFAKTLGAVLHRPAILPVPKFGPSLLLGRELAHELLFAGQRVVPTVLEQHGFEWEHPDLESALQSLLRPGVRGG